MSAQEVSKSKKYELVPPDGGWGYVIGVAVTIILTTIHAFIPSFGMIYNQLYLELKMNSTDITVMNGISAVTMAISGFMISPILRFLTIRQLGLVSVIILNLGYILTVFVRSKITFIICMGICQSFGNGIIINLSFTVLNNYFVKKRLLAVSFTQTIVGVVTLFVPQFIKWALDTYGLRGTLLLIAGVSMQNIIGMVLLQPVEWHMKRIQVPENEDNEKKSLLAIEKENNKEDLTSSFKTPPKNLTESVDEKHILEEQLQKHNKGLKGFIEKSIDVPFLRSYLLSNASVGLALCIFADLTLTIMLPQALYSIGWTESDVAFALSLNATGDLVMRILFILLHKWLKDIGSHEIYVAGLAIAFISRLGMFWSVNMTLILVFITTSGMSRCSMLMLVPMVVADAVAEEKFTSAMGVFLAIYGLFTMVLGPIIGKY
ncbi:unnamed protein product, partial [Brenthis ino]